MKCELILSLKGVMPGWGCCQCRMYNGLQRKQCRSCGHECCHPEKPKPEQFGLCNECGVPKGARHQGHLEGEVFGGGELTRPTMADLIKKQNGGQVW